jgi:hypothetical protein
MRVYEVQPGDSPASIAARDEMAGCPKCAIDLIRANPHKEAVVHPNGFATFKDLRAGEKLNLPNKWFNGDLDSRPKAYFAALPYPDGKTPSALGALADGVLSDYTTFDSASAQVNALPQLDIPAFTNAVDVACSTIDQAVNEVGSNPTAAGMAQDTRAAVAWARARNAELGTALKSGNDAEVNAARTGIQNVLATALDSARLALQAFYGNVTVDIGPVKIDPVHTPPKTPKAAPLPPVSDPKLLAVNPPQKEKGLSTGAVLGLGLLGAGAVGGVIYLATNKPATRRPRVRRVYLGGLP